MKQYDLLLRNHIKYKKRLAETQITVEKICKLQYR